ncbi:hypothetical protein BKA57DRAFT_45807 [Linnemannia elongata]|nr:hypothetical protein BKA57DRAFT_45807 [Linnemannia elongata]
MVTRVQDSSKEKKASVIISYIFVVIFVIVFVFLSLVVVIKCRNSGAQPTTGIRANITPGLSKTTIDSDFVLFRFVSYFFFFFLFFFFFFFFFLVS